MGESYSGYAVETKDGWRAWEQDAEDPKVYLKRVWNRLEEISLEPSERVLSLWTIAMALITLAHTKDVSEPKR